MKHILQRTQDECGIATLAMITGEPYEQVRAEFPFFKDGIDEWEVRAYLAERGYACAQVYIHYAPMRVNLPERVKPFTDVHFAYVDDRHFVVVLRDGTVLDPARPQPRHIDQYKVSWICGVVKCP